MENKELKSTDFPRLNATTKDLVNMGEWFLYEIAAKETARFVLATDAMAYYLDGKGGVVSKAPKIQDDEIILSRIIFNDIPSSAKNFSICVC